MRHGVRFHSAAKKEFSKLDFHVRDKFNKIIRTYSVGEDLTRNKYKEFRGLDLFEFRVKHDGNIYRALVGRINSISVIVLFFSKKSQKTPKRYIDTAKKRLIQCYEK